MNFNDRVITQTFSEEFIKEMAGVEPKNAPERLEHAAKRFEKSYPAVAMVTQDDGWTTTWAIKIIPKHDADHKAIQQGTQNLHYWMSGADE